MTIVCYSDRDPAKEVAIMRAIEDRPIDGIIFNPPARYPEQVDIFKGLRVPLVLLGARLSDAELDLVLTNLQGAYEPVIYLISPGHRQVSPIRANRTNVQRPGKFTSYVEALRDAGLRISQDVSIVGFDDILQALIITPPLTTVAVPKGEMGRTATNLLLRRIDNPSAPFERVILPHTIRHPRVIGPRRKKECRSKVRRRQSFRDFVPTNIFSAITLSFITRIYRPSKVVNCRFRFGFALGGMYGYRDRT